MQQRLLHPGSQHRTQAERHVRAVPHLLQRHGDDMRQTLTAVLRGTTQAVPAGGDKLRIRVPESVGRSVHAVAPLRALFVAAAVQRIEHALRKFSSLGEHHLDQFGIDVPAAGQGGDAVHAGELGNRELHVLQRRGIGRHVMVPTKGFPQKSKGTVRAPFDVTASN